MNKLENLECALWNIRGNQIDGFNGNCVVQAVKNNQILCIHFTGESKQKAKTADVPKNCFVANIARKLPPIDEMV